jgi:signal transduction histidine kinase
VRGRLIWTVAASVSMVLLAMLVPMAVLLQDYALEDQLSRAALEVQATETVVSAAGDDRGDLAVYVATINEDEAIQTTVLFPGGEALGPDPGEDARVVAARVTGIARLDDVEDGAQILVPVSLGGTSGTPAQTPVIRVVVTEPGLGTGIFRVWLVLLGLGLVLFLGALVLADRLGRSFVQPIQSLAAYTRRLGERPRPTPVEVEGPEEIRELGQALNRLVERIEVLLARERENVSDLSHRLRTPVTALQLRIDALPDPVERQRLAADLGELRAMVDQVVREARRSEREGLVAECDGRAVLVERARFWEPLAEDQARPFTLTDTAAGPVPVRAVEEDVTALLDVLLDNVFSHTQEGTPVRVVVARRRGGGLVLTVADGGPGFSAAAVERGSSGAGSSGLGLSIAAKTARESGGSLTVGPAPTGGAAVVVELGPPW